KETVTVGKSALKEEPFTPQVLRRTRVLAGIDFTAAPPLLGHVLARPRPTAELVLTADRGEPLLAWWRYGLGMTVAFTSDAGATGAVEWPPWPGYDKFWAQVVRHALRRNESRGAAVQIEAKGRHVTVTLDAVNAVGRYLNGAEAELTV